MEKRSVIFILNSCLGVNHHIMEEPKQEPSEGDQNMADKLKNLKARIKEQETQINQMKTLIENGNVKTGTTENCSE